MKKSILFVLGGLGLGGVETYVVRLAKQLVSDGHYVEILLLSSKVDPGLRRQLNGVAKIRVFDRFPMLKASSWLNGMSIIKEDLGSFDFVHVVDMLTLGFLYFNRRAIQFKSLSIGVYHSAELDWWRYSKVYFRDLHLRLYDLNVQATLFPSESVARMASLITGAPLESLDLVPLGIELVKYSDCKPNRLSRRIVSVGRLVSFKTYNRHIISELPSLRLVDNFVYEIYGEGPEMNDLKRFAEQTGVAEFVIFKGGISYERLPEVFSGAFCFVGSGTSIIEAAASGIPSIVGIESMKEPLTCGLFADILGFSYNESSATSVRVRFSEVIHALHQLDDDQYQIISASHRKKAGDFDLRLTAQSFVEKSNRIPNFSIGGSRIRSLFSFFLGLVRMGPQALRGRSDQKSAC